VLAVCADAIEIAQMPMREAMRKFFVRMEGSLDTARIAVLLQ
jgi:hypothetical protein